MKKFAIIFVVLLIIVGISRFLHISESSSGQEEIADAEVVDETGFIHTVFFWLNEDVSEEEKEKFVNEGLTNLLEVPSIYKAYIGPPAMTPRDVVDNSYGYALVCHFKNKEDQDAYQDDPIHLKFIEDYKHLWKKVQVYDNLVTN